MIKGNIKNIEDYTDLSERINLGLKYLKNTDFSTIENGKYEISQNEVFAIVQDYISKPLEEGKFETHRKYIDIQYIVKGEEQIGVGNINDFSQSTDYDEEKDILFLIPKNKKNVFIKLKESDFAIFYPQDVHMPSITIQEPHYVKKIVIKILL